MLLFVLGKCFDALKVAARKMVFGLCFSVSPINHDVGLLTFYSNPQTLAFNVMFLNNIFGVGNSYVLVYNIMPLRLFQHHKPCI
jgi:hypothetical protein